MLYRGPQKPAADGLWLAPCLPEHLERLARAVREWPWAIDDSWADHTLERFLALAGQPNTLFLSVLQGDRWVGAIHFNLIRPHRDAWINAYANITGLGPFLASAVVRAATYFAFRDLGLCKLTAELCAENRAAQAVLERAGYREEGRLRLLRYHGGQAYDMLVMGVTVSEMGEGC